MGIGTNGRWRRMKVNGIFIEYIDTDELLYLIDLMKTEIRERKEFVEVWRMNFNEWIKNRYYSLYLKELLYKEYCEFLDAVKEEEEWEYYLMKMIIQRKN